MLEDLIRNAIADGRLVNMTMWHTSQGWQCSMSIGINPWKVRVADDPIDALTQMPNASLGSQREADIDPFA